MKKEVIIKKINTISKQLENVQASINCTPTGKLSRTKQQNYQSQLYKKSKYQKELVICNLLLDKITNTGVLGDLTEIYDEIFYKLYFSDLHLPSTCCLQEIINNDKLYNVIDGNYVTLEEIKEILKKAIENNSNYVDNLKNTIKRYELIKKYFKHFRNCPTYIETHYKEWCNPVVEEDKEDKIKLLTQKAFNNNVGVDFFPTPPEVVEFLVDGLNITENTSILEPSAGCGNILDYLKSKYTFKYEPECCEISSSLREILELKGHKIYTSDFMDLDKHYDMIIMNPPFSCMIEHVKQAIKYGEIIRCILPPIWLTSTQKKYVEFRQFLTNNGTWSTTKIPSQSFKSSGTNVETIRLDFLKNK